MKRGLPFILSGLALVAVGGVSLAIDFETHPSRSRTQTYRDLLVADVIEEIPLIYPDTQAAYLVKRFPSTRKVAYVIEFTLPYATYSSFTTYQDTKPVAALRDREYKIEGRHPNPYQPGNRIITSRGRRKVVLTVTPEFDLAVLQGAQNPLATGTTKERNLIFGRVYYANRNSVPCFSNADGAFSSSPIENAGSIAHMGAAAPITVHCDYTPGSLTESFLDSCLLDVFAASEEDWQCARE